MILIGPAVGWAAAGCSGLLTPQAFRQGSASAACAIASSDYPRVGVASSFPATGLYARATPQVPLALTASVLEDPLRLGSVRGRTLREVLRLARCLPYDLALAIRGIAREIDLDQCEARPGLLHRPDMGGGRAPVGGGEGQCGQADPEGTAPAALRDRLTSLETRKAELERELATTEAPAPRLHPNLAEVYRQRIALLAEALSSDDGAEERELVRGLVEEIRLIPEGGRLRIEVRGELGVILHLAEGARVVGSKNDKSPGSVHEAFVVQIKMDAGTRNRRCQYTTVAI